MLVRLAGACPDNAGEDGGAADGGQRRHPLAEEQRGGEEREDGIQVYVIGGTDVPEFVDDEVPADEAGQGRRYAGSIGVIGRKELFQVQQRLRLRGQVREDVGIGNREFGHPGRVGRDLILLVGEHEAVLAGIRGPPRERDDTGFQ